MASTEHQTDLCPYVRRPAFSLLELMVVIAVVAVLAIIVTGGLNTVVSARANVHCTNNLRSLGLAMKSYIEESGQVLNSFHGGAVADDMWPRKLMLGGYLNQNTSGANENAILLGQIDSVGDIMRCPIGAIEDSFLSDSAQVRSHPRRWGWQAYGLGMYRSDLPLSVNTDNSGRTVSFQTRIVDIDEPSRYILFADSSGAGPNYYQSFRISRYAGEGGIALRHKGYANVYFLDGHIERIDATVAERLGVPTHSIYRLPD